MSEIKLLPCPFCGGEAEYCKGDWIGKEYWVKCTKCSCKTSLSNNYKKPIDEWNTRKPMERIIEKLEDKKWGTSEWRDKWRDEIIGECIEVVKEEGGIDG